jgi:hypothetical protein
MRAQALLKEGSKTKIFLRPIAPLPLPGRLKTILLRGRIKLPPLTL